METYAAEVRTPLGCEENYPVVVSICPAPAELSGFSEGKMLKISRHAAKKLEPGRFLNPPFGIPCYGIRSVAIQQRKKRQFEKEKNIKVLHSYPLTGAVM